MTEAVTITGSFHCLMPNGPLRVRLSGQLPTETQWTLCQFTIVLPFVRQPRTNTALFTDLWIIQLKQNGMTHFWSKSYYQGEEAFSWRYVFLFTEDKSLSSSTRSLTGRIKQQNGKSPGNIGRSVCLNLRKHLMLREAVHSQTTACCRDLTSEDFKKGKKTCYF